MKRKNLLCGACLATVLTVCPISVIYGAQTDEYTDSNLTESSQEELFQTDALQGGLSSEIQENQDIQETQETLSKESQTSFPESEVQKDSQTQTMTQEPSQETSSDETAEEERTASQEKTQPETSQTEKPQQEESDTPSAATFQEGWIKNSTGWWYQNEDGSYPVSQWKKIKGTWYYFLPSGYMATGWQLLNGNWYYLHSSGAMATDWQFINGSWYYMNSSGSMVTGWQLINGSWYYMSPSGAMQTGWQRINGSWYYMNPSGVMTTGWQLVHDTWYYMNASGAMQTGWLKLNNTWYYLNGSGAMQTGWLKTGSQWYYFTESGNMVSSSWKEINDKWYYFHSDGSMASNTWIGNCYVNDSGEWVEETEASGYIWPCPGYTTITSDYGYRGAPTAGASTYHKGIDIGAPHGSKVTSVCNGRVIAYGYNSSMGNYVKIQHADNVVSVYMHMSKIAGISTGQTVTAGTVIGYVGSTGVSTGPHLHLGIMLNNDYVSPWNYLKRPN